VVAACEQSGFEPRVRAFADPPPQAMVARLRTTREVGLPPASFAFHAAAAEPEVVARTIVQPGIPPLSSEHRLALSRNRATTYDRRHSAGKRRPASVPARRNAGTSRSATRRPVLAYDRCRDRSRGEE
jgi:hypothetical protein